MSMGWCLVLLKESERGVAEYPTLSIHGYMAHKSDESAIRATDGLLHDEAVKYFAVYRVNCDLSVTLLVEYDPSLIGLPGYGKNVIEANIRSLIMGKICYETMSSRLFKV